MTSYEPEQTEDADEQDARDYAARQYELEEWLKLSEVEREDRISVAIRCW